ncbi:hypothetical protein EIP91_004559 [Steccherinum ochraceum]|uniref:HTH La-type RNA-binding domain-containing protein n=1 Tax=Steccherinum ochraceum TaxID=92696 RepID=A0A4V2MVW7_9APHY|nr:hypothetical protein EIP91_004559 [Steccherinum ochraceum]
MVSPAPSAPQKPPVLSYADRAKKARNLNSPNTPTVRATPPSISTPSSTTSLANAHVPPPPPPQQLASERTKTASPQNANHATSQDSSSITSSTTASRSSKDSTQESRESPSSSSHSTSEQAAKVAATAPVTNFWNVRKEQMAQARANNSYPSSSSSSAQLPGAQENGVSHGPLVPTLTPNGGPVATFVSSVRPAVNGNGTENHHSKKGSVMAQASRNPVPPPVEDTTSWPTVGMSVAAPSPRAANSEASGTVESSSKGDDQKAKDDDKGDRNGIASKKGEKHKWVPIPTEELLAVADEHRHRSSQRSPGQSRSRSSQQHNQANIPQGSKPTSVAASTPGSVSGQNSQGQSRNQSVTGTRETASQSGSIPPSQAESRVGSVHSSPRHQSSSRRRMPDDSVGSRNRSLRSSRAPSPHVVGRPLQAEDLNIRVDAIHLGQQLYSAPAYIRPYTDVGQGVGDAYYASMPPPHNVSNSQPQSYHSTHTSNSPANNPYALPPTAPPPNMYTSPPPHMLAGASQYQMYPPFPFPSYAQPPPFGPWSASTPGQAPSLYPGPPQYHHSRSPSNQSGYSPAMGPTVNPTIDTLVSEGIPPPTMISRPPPPGQSDAVAGYREVGFFSPSPSAHTVAAEGPEPDVSASRGRQAKEFSFGTIKRPVANKTPSPPPAAVSEAVQVERPSEETKLPESESAGLGSDQSAFPVFSIGINPGDESPARARSKTHPKSTSASHERGNTAPAKLGRSFSREGGQDDASELVDDQSAPEVKVIDLTDSVTPTWQFGTTKADGVDDADQVSSAPLTHESQHNGVSLPLSLLDAQAAQEMAQMPLTDISTSLAPTPQHSQYTSRSQMPPLNTDSPNGPLLPSPSPSAPYPHSSVSMVSPSSEHRVADDWEVKNYGYGFGRGSNGPILVPNAGRGEREFAPREYGRPRRGSYGGGYGYDRGGGHERGGYSGRRGRGMNSGFGGRGFGGRNAARGGYQQAQSSRPPFTVTQQPIGPIDQSYYAPAPPPPQGTTFFHQPLGYDFAPYPYVPAPVSSTSSPTAQAPPPLPMPQSLLSFPLDPTRYYLLGQLEYYLSAQNLAQDFYLRQHMDSRGWVSIPLIASFNRIQQLTVDLHLVKDVLSLSSLVEVRGEFVRVRSWQQYVLPTAVPSVVEADEEYTFQSYAHPEYEEAVSSTSEGVEQESTSHEGDEDEISEEEVEFVMGKEAQGTWTPERSTNTSAATAAS